jgi:hypothetical protein
MKFATAVGCLLAISSPHGSDAKSSYNGGASVIGKFDRKLKGADSVTTHKRRASKEFQSNRKLDIIQESTDDVMAVRSRSERSISMGGMSRAERVRYSKRSVATATAQKHRELYTG